MEAVTCREAKLGTDALAAPAAASPTAVLAHRPREPFGYLALAGHRGRQRWRYPVLLLHKRGILVAPIGRVHRPSADTRAIHCTRVQGYAVNHWGWRSKS